MVRCKFYTAEKETMHENGLEIFIFLLVHFQFLSAFAKLCKGEC